MADFFFFFGGVGGGSGCGFFVWSRREVETGPVIPFSAGLCAYYVSLEPVIESVAAVGLFLFAGPLLLSSSLAGFVCCAFFSSLLFSLWFYFITGGPPQRCSGNNNIVILPTTPSSINTPANRHGGLVVKASAS